jgi:NTP pyrophosphatase (non-canonical NTP hydrolase)
MTGNEYQKLASRTMLNELDHEIPADQLMLVWNALGLAGEAGEVADEVKKFVFHQKDFDRAKLIKELGDVAWYMAAICTDIGVGLEEVFEANIQKLQERFPDGYSSKAANKRFEGREDVENKTTN